MEVSFSKLRTIFSPTPRAFKQGLLAAICLVMVFSPLWAADEYHVKEGATGLELFTPQGKKVITGNFNPTGNGRYRFEIPLSDLQKAEEEEEEGAEGKSTHSTQDIRIINSLDPNAPKPSPSPSPVKKDDDDEDEPKKTSKRKIPPRVIVEYDDSDRMVLEANRLYYRRKYYEAGVVLEELLRKRPDYVRAWIMKGSVLKVLGQKELAKAAWEKAAALDPENKELKGMLEKEK